MSDSSDDFSPPQSDLNNHSVEKFKEMRREAGWPALPAAGTARLDERPEPCPLRTSSDSTRSGTL